MRVDQGPAPDARYYRRHAPKQPGASEYDAANPYPLPDDVRAIHGKKRGRRYMFRTGELIVGPGQSNEAELERQLDEVWRADPYEPEPPSGDSPEDEKARDRAELAAEALRRSNMRLYRLRDAENRLAREDVPAAVRSLRNQAWDVWPNHVLGVQQDGEYGPATPPEELDPPPVFRPEGGGGGLRIAVVDTGVRPNHHLLLDHVETRPGNVDLEVLDVSPDDDRRDYVAGHGTFIAGVIRLGAPNAMIVVRGTVRSNGTVSDSEVAGAIDNLAESEDEIHILNLSLGGYTHGDDLLRAGRKPLPGAGGAVGLPCTAVALARLRTKHPRIVVVAAAGNDARREAFYPAALDDVIGVGALDTNSNKAPFSNRGDWVDVWALGVDIESSFVGPDLDQLGGGNADPDAAVRWSGTSFAAPRFAAMLLTAMSP